MEMTPSHLSSTLLKHVSLKFYLDDSAHLLQPLNQGIVRDFKAYFRRRLLQTALAHSSASEGGEERGHQTMKTVTELDAMFWIQVRLLNIFFKCVRSLKWLILTFKRVVGSGLKTKQTNVNTHWELENITFFVVVDSVYVAFKIGQGNQYCNACVNSVEISIM